MLLSQISYCLSYCRSSKGPMPFYFFVRAIETAKLAGTHLTSGSSNGCTSAILSHSHYRLSLLGTNRVCRQALRNP